MDMRSHRGWPKAFRWNGVMHDVCQIADVWVVEGKSWEPDGGEKSRCFRAFTKYTDAGFLITPERYDGEYDALGQIYVYAYPEARRGFDHV